MRCCQIVCFIKKYYGFVNLYNIFFIIICYVIYIYLSDGQAFSTAILFHWQHCFIIWFLNLFTIHIRWYCFAAATDADDDIDCHAEISENTNYLIIYMNARIPHRAENEIGIK